MEISNIINLIYEKMAYHVKYSVNKDGIIVKEEKNKFLNIGSYNRIITLILTCFLFIFIFGLTTNALNRRSQGKLFLETFYVNQLCFESDDLGECYTIPRNHAISIYLEDVNNTKTLFIHGE